MDTARKKKKEKTKKKMERWNRQKNTPTRNRQEIYGKIGMQEGMGRKASENAVNR